jgi:hypothetical protein
LASKQAHANLGYRLPPTGQLVPCWLLQRFSAGLQGQGSSQQIVEDGMGDGGGLWYFPHCYVCF